MLQRLDKLTTESLDRNPWWDYRHDTYSHPDGSQGDFYYIQTRGSVFVIPELEDGRLLLLRQFRYLNQLESLEFVGGGLKGNATAEESAREELQEEAGYEAGRLTSLGWFNPMNGASDEKCYVFIASELTKSRARPEISEEFESESVTIDELIGLIQSGKIWDGMTLASFSLYLLKHTSKLHQAEDERPGANIL